MHLIKPIEEAQNKFGSEGAKYISEALKENTFLTNLSLCSSNFWKNAQKKEINNHYFSAENELGPEGAKFIFEALKHNETLISLDLSLK